MNINWEQLGKQLTDWGGDYDVFSDVSFDGGARDSVLPGKPGYDDSVRSTQGATKPGYDNTGRLVAATDNKSTTGKTRPQLPGSDVNVVGGG